MKRATLLGTSNMTRVGPNDVLVRVHLTEARRLIGEAVKTWSR